MHFLEAAVTKGRDKMKRENSIASDRNGSPKQISLRSKTKLGMPKMVASSFIFISMFSFGCSEFFMEEESEGSDVECSGPETTEWDEESRMLEPSYEITSWLHDALSESCPNKPYESLDYTDALVAGIDISEEHVIDLNLAIAERNDVLNEGLGIHFGDEEPIPELCDEDLNAETEWVFEVVNELAFEWNIDLHELDEQNESGEFSSPNSEDEAFFSDEEIQYFEDAMAFSVLALCYQGDLNNCSFFIGSWLRKIARWLLRKEAKKKAMNAARREALNRLLQKRARKQLHAAIVKAAARGAAAIRNRVKEVLGALDKSRLLLKKRWTDLQGYLTKTKLTPQELEDFGVARNKLAAAIAKIGGLIAGALALIKWLEEEKSVALNKEPDEAKKVAISKVYDENINAVKEKIKVVKEEVAKSVKRKEEVDQVLNNHR